MTTTRDEIERLMISYGLECYAEGKTQLAADTKAKGAALLSAIDRVLAERDTRIAVLSSDLGSAIALYGDAKARIAALEKALTDIRDEADVYELELTETNVRMRLRAIFNTSRNALRALAQPEQEKPPTT